MEKIYNVSFVKTKEAMMKNPDDVTRILSLHSLGWGTRRIADQLGISRNTVKKYVKQGSWVPYKKPKKHRSLEAFTEWIKQKFYQHRGNAVVLQEELKTSQGIHVSLRTVEREVQNYRRDLKARSVATLRFETPPGKQLQIDFGSIHVFIGDEKTKVFLFVATLGFSRRMYIAAFPHERQEAWFQGLEGSFYHFNGVPKEVLMDNPRALVQRHDIQTREVLFNRRFKAFANYWDFCPRACAPYRARTKGKDERAIRYVKENCIAGRTFSSWQHFEQHLDVWNRTVADERIHGTTQEKPLDRFHREEALSLRPLEGKPPFVQTRELARRVHSDSFVEVDTNRYSVPSQWVKKDLTIQIKDGLVKMFYGQEEIASHQEKKGRHQTILEPSHLKGIVEMTYKRDLKNSDLQRSLKSYETLVGGTWL